MPPVVRLFLFAITILLPSNIHAAWPLNGAPVCTVSGSHAAPEAVSDGQGGIIIVWQDFRNGDPDIYAQRLDGWGNELWTPGGVQVSSGNSLEQTPRLASDGAGGAMIAWEHAVVDYDIRAQRVDASGNPLWQANGVVVCGLISSQQEPQLIPDGSGGVVIAWHDIRLGNWDVFAQRVDATGARLWTPDGVAVCIETSSQFRPRLASDGSGGVFAVWEDFRNAFQYDIYMQRIGPAGTPYLAADGVPLCSFGVNQLSPQIASLDIGGAVVVWEDYRTGAFSPATFAQRITSNGGTAWTVDGIQVCTFGGGEFEPQVVPDNDHGVIVSWRDMRALGDVYAQRLDAFGTRLWSSTGVALTGSGQQFAPRMASDGNGGAFVSWIDHRYSPDGDIYAGHLNAAGTPLGTANGTAIAVVPGLQFRAPIVSDGQGGAIMAWEDLRSSDSHIYSQRIDRYGNWGYPSAEIVSASDVPGDQGGQVNLAWNASRLDPWPAQYIDRYTVWRALDPALASMLLAAGDTPLVSADAVPPGTLNGIRLETMAGATSFWQLIASLDAYHLSSYGYAAPTLFDSTLTSPDAHHFQVIAHHDAGNEYWISPPASARSVDNLAPAAPLLLTAQRVGADVLLNWTRSAENEEDLAGYRVYRASSAGVQPLPESFLTDSPDTLLTDVSPPAGFLYYIVTAEDIHGNQSPPSNEASVALPTGAGDTPSPSRLALRGNFPNPFGASTEVRVGLPRASDVRLEVFDVVGRRVAVRTTAGVAPGWQSIAFDGRDERGGRLASGVYFYRVTAAGETRTHKMVIQR